MAKHQQRELEKLKKRILSLGTFVEERVRMAIKSIETRDADLARRVIKMDYEIDELEVEVEEDCLKILALYQPVAVDLRFLVAVIKINNDLERIGDEAVNIAHRVNTIASKTKVDVPFDYSTMTEKVAFMLKTSLDALVNVDLDLAFRVMTMDDEVDDIEREIYDQVKGVIREKKSRVGYLINLLMISRHLERIADHATNIANDVIYMVEGEIIRHKPEDSGDK